MITVPYTPYRKFDIDPKPAWGIKQGVVFLRCQCGQLANLDEWTVDDEGKVMPSVHHDATDGGCGFHEHIQLENWQEHNHE